MITLSYPDVLSLLEPHLGAKRSESAAFLIWYFENYLRLDRLDATDAVCDQPGDKGIDGIYLNSDANLIEIYQSKLFQKANPDISYSRASCKIAKPNGFSRESLTSG